MRFKLKSHLIEGLIFLISGSLVSAKTIKHNTLGITIFVYNTARVRPPDLAQAEQQAATIFREAGIVTAWVDCSSAGLAEACRQTAGPNQFILHIVAHGKTSTDAVFGLAFLGTDGSGKYSDVFYDRIEDMHRDCGASPPRLLATVAAHEIGHLLLGSHSHSAMGIMSPRWNREELRHVNMGWMYFTSEQASRMRARIEEDYWRRRGNDVLASSGDSK